MRGFKMFATSALLVGMSACSSGQATKNAAMALPFVMDQEDHIAIQRPNLPNTRLLAWTPSDRLYQSVTIDFVEGMSQQSYIFSKPNQQLLRPLLVGALENSGLLAHTREEARYALQIHFTDIHANSVGFDFAGRSTAIYNIVSRATGEVVFSDTINANFLVKYPELNERDFAEAYDTSKPAVLGLAKVHVDSAIIEGGVVELINNNSALTDFFGGKINEASQASWDDFNQAFIWSEGVALLAGPLEVLRKQLDPTNYIAFASNRPMPKNAVSGARQGYLAESGYGS